MHCTSKGQDIKCDKFPQTGTAPQFSARVFCAQTAGWIKMPLDMEVGNDQATLCYMGSQLPPQNGAEPPILGRCLLWPNGAWIKVPFVMDVGLGPGHIVIDGDPAPVPQKRWHSSTPIFGPYLLWPNGWMDQDDTWHWGKPRPRPYCARWRPSSPPKKGTPPIFSPCHVCCSQMAGWIS